MRKRHGSIFWWYSFFSVFLLQGALMLIVAVPLIYVMSGHQERPLSFFYWIGACFWMFGFILEAGGDFQLTQFKRNPDNKGKLLSSGLWSITRHPNYFGDTLQWWGFGFFAIAGFKPAGLASLIGPLVMTLLIVKVSGVALLEKNLTSSKPGYAEYIARTPAFFPRWWFWAVLAVTSLLFVAVGGLFN
jgi:steroid 5-alpha reductase family enzyme